MQGLTGASFATVADLRAHLKRTERAEGDFEAKATAALNAAADTLRTATGRVLRSVTYRTAVSVGSLTATLDVDAGTATLTGDQGVFSGGLVLPDDEVVSETLTVEARVLTASDDYVTITPAHPDDRSSGTFTFGSEPMVLSGDGTDEILTDEWPITAVHSAAWWNGTEWVALDLTGARFGGASLRLARDVFPDGERNVRLELTAGYLEPRPGVRGHPLAWGELKRLTLRLAEMHFLDDLSLRGRTKSLGGPGGGAVLESVWPNDVAQMIYRYTRLA